jgi:RecB family exonuclease
VRVERISYSDLSLFRRCGLRFFAERVLRLGGDASRADASELGMGSALHAVLQVSNAGTMPPNERVEAIGRRFRLDPAALQSVRRAAMSFLESRLSHELESHDVVRREWSFSVRLAVLGAPVYLSGSIDAYGRTEDSGLVVDYKSGDSGGEDELRERYELQAKCYALAVLEDGCTKADVVFSRPQVAGPDGEPQEIRYSFTAADRADLEAEIVAIHAAMEAGSLTPRETWDRYACRECAAAYSICSRRERS